MKIWLLIILTGIMAMFLSCQPPTTTEPPPDINHEITFYTPDSLQLFGDLYEVDKAAPIILLFHQGGSNARAEYGPIIPELVAEGYNVLAIDQRQGGQIYGLYNRTVAQLPLNQFGYCDAYPDLESTLNYVIESGFTGQKIVWGSSYSATLAIQLAAKHPDKITAVLAFSPASGGPMQACLPDEYLASLKSPLLLLRPGREMEIESVQNQYALAQTHGHQTYTAENGVHGSSLLVPERVEGDVTGSWEVVKGFLAKQR